MHMTDRFYNHMQKQNCLFPSPPLITSVEQEHLPHKYFDIYRFLRTTNPILFSMNNCLQAICLRPSHEHKTTPHKQPHLNQKVSGELKWQLPVMLQTRLWLSSSAFLCFRHTVPAVVNTVLQRTNYTTLHNFIRIENQRRP